MLEYINIFNGEYACLNNSYTTAIEFDGIIYSNAEAVYQAQKTIIKEEREQFKNLQAILAKKVGHTIQLRQDWENIKDSVMLNVIRAKFMQNELLEDILIHTAPAKLIGYNAWNNRHWGMCGNVGLNMFGKILMQVRDEILTLSKYRKNKEEYGTNKINNINQ